MDVFDAIKKRRSVRGYLDREVEQEKLDVILEAAQLAPSASNRQEWRFVVVKDSETRKKLRQAAKGKQFVEEAPVILACCAKTDNHIMTCGQLCYPIDVAIAIDHMTLVAVELGLGTCWVGAFYEDQVKEILNIPKDIRVVELLTIGYAKDVPSLRKRLKLEEIACYDDWSLQG